MQPAVRLVLAFFRPLRPLLACVAVLAVVVAVMGAVEPLFYRSLLDAFAAPEGEPRSAPVLVVGLVALLLGREVAAAGLDVLVWRVRLTVNYEMLGDTVDRLHKLPVSHHRDDSVGAVMTRVERGITGVLTAFSEVAVHLVPSLVYLAISAVVVVTLDWRLALVVVFFAPMPALVGVYATKEQTARERSLMARWIALFARLHEVLAGIAVVKSFVKEDDEKRRFLGGVREANGIVMRGVASDARVMAARNGIVALARIATITVGGWLVVQHEISLGTLVAVLAYLGGILQPVQALTGMYQSLRKGSVCAETVASILGARAHLDDAPSAHDPGRLRGEVRFEDVGFEYRHGHPCLEGITLHARPGEMIALVGSSGAGKTTLVSLLQRLYDPTAGRILVDGRDLRDLRQRALRRQIGVVFQDEVLFSDTVRENIAFGRPGATHDQIEQAARAALAHDFITALPQGYDTPIGERGCKLSGGERQRVAIARAILKDAPILVLDEASSALDVDTEEKVHLALAQLRQGRTTFVIAHRLGTVRSADCIVVLERGRIVEAGTHEKLMQLGGRYAAMYERQVRNMVARSYAA